MTKKCDFNSFIHNFVLVYITNTAKPTSQNSAYDKITLQAAQQGRQSL